MNNKITEYENKKEKADVRWKKRKENKEKLIRKGEKKTNKFPKADIFSGFKAINLGKIK